MNTNLINSTKNMARATIKNATASVILAILVIGFTLVRTSLTTQAFGVDSLGLLTIVIGILPYIATGHNGLTSVSIAKLYQSIHYKDYSKTSQQIADLKPQFYLFGTFYLVITIVIAFAFPFIINPSGNIIVSTSNSIMWYQSTLFILSNTVELFSTYFIIPISVILLFITKKAYISNWYSIGLTIILNMIIILIFILVIQGTINISFVIMNIIIFVILGTKMMLLLSILYFYKRRYFPWYKKLKASTWKLKAASLQAVGSQYLNQFSSDLIAIIFMLYAAINITQNQVVPLHDGPQVGEGTSNFVPSAIFSTYLLLINSGREVVHSIVDAAIPSVAEHVSFNKSKLSCHMFHRYQVLSVYIALFTISTYILTGGIAQSLFLHDQYETADFASNNINLYLIGLLWIPTLIEIFAEMYAHLLPMFNKFKLLLKITAIKSAINLVLLAITIPLLFAFVNNTYLMNAVFIAIILSGIIANMVSYLLYRLNIYKMIQKDDCVNVLASTFWCFIWVIICMIIMLPIYIIFETQISHLIESIGFINVTLITLSIGIFNFIWCLLWIFLFRKYDFKFYSSELRKMLHLGIK